MKFAGKEIDAVVYDSRKACENSVFVCLKGAVSDGHDYVRAVYEKGCRCFVAERQLDLPGDAVQTIVENTRIALAVLSADFYGRPAQKLKLIGVTGTKGKTTVSYLIYEILNHSGRKAGLIGTNGIFMNGKCTPTANSTPESEILHRTFSDMLKCGCEYAVIEVSSQGIKQHRVHGISFDIGIFTNLSPDHIGPTEHENYEEYRECKARLFAASEVSILNADDASFEYMAKRAKRHILTYSLDGQSDYMAENIELQQTKDALGVAFDCKQKDTRYSMNIPGIFNVYNGLAAIAACDILGVSRSQAASALATSAIAGRFEIIRDQSEHQIYSDRTFIIDYAHNGLSLESALSTLRVYNPARLICVFGSVGERTQHRREELGIAASKYADFCIITSDNPGEEDPHRIISEIEQFVKIPHVCITDRTEAVRYAVENSEAGDIILFAGKGNENYQLIGKEKVPFCERDLILDTLQKIYANQTETALTSLTSQKL